MARKAKERSSGGRLSRSETVTIRLDPRLNHLCELAARAQRRTKSSFIEAVIDQAINDIRLDHRYENSSTIGSQADKLWNIREHERLIALADEAAHLMTLDEQEIWATICENGYFWRGSWSANDTEKVWKWSCEPAKIIHDHVAEYWSEIVKVAAGEAPHEALPKWIKTRPIVLDDEIPF